MRSVRSAAQVVLFAQLMYVSVPPSQYVRPRGKCIVNQEVSAQQMYQYRRRNMKVNHEAHAWAAIPFTWTDIHYLLGGDTFHGGGINRTYGLPYLKEPIN